MKLPFEIPIRVRPDVQTFASMMERELSEHDEKKGRTGYVGLHPLRLFARLSSEVGDLSEMLHPLFVEGNSGMLQRYSKNPNKLEAAIRECADVANQAMMIARALSDWLYD